MYAAIFDLHGWGGAREELSELARRREWQAMAGLVTDEMVDTFATVAQPSQLLAKLQERYGGLAQRAILYPVAELSAAAQEAVFAARPGAG
jgi:hypothetical protein